MTNLKKFIKRALSLMPVMKSVIHTRSTQSPITFQNLFFQKIMRINGKAYWPMHFTSMVTYPEEIKLGVDTAPGIMPGCYIQGVGGILIGSYTQIAANVGLISRNHDVTNLRIHVEVEKPSIIIGEYSWLGMNSVILPNVKLGDFTVVAAGAVVTKSFLDGYCILAGNPARVIGKLIHPHVLDIKMKLSIVAFIG